MSLLVHKFSLFYYSLMSYKYVNILGAQGSNMSSGAAGWELGKVSKLFYCHGCPRGLAFSRFHFKSQKFVGVSPLTPGATTND